jgi:hypothetical protein
MPDNAISYENIPLTPLSPMNGSTANSTASLNGNVYLSKLPVQSTQSMNLTLSPDAAIAMAPFPVQNTRTLTASAALQELLGGSAIVPTGPDPIKILPGVYTEEQLNQIPGKQAQLLGQYVLDDEEFFAFSTARVAETYWQKQGFFLKFSDHQLTTSWFVPKQVVFSARFLFAFVLLTVLVLSIKRDWSEIYYASFTNIAYSCLVIYYLVLFVAGVRHTVFNYKGQYIIPSKLIRQMCFVLGPIQPPLQVVSVIGFWVAKGLNGWAEPDHTAAFIDLGMHGLQLLIGTYLQKVAYSSSDYRFTALVTAANGVGKRNCIIDHCCLVHCPVLDSSSTFSRIKVRSFAEKLTCQSIGFWDSVAGGSDLSNWKDPNNIWKYGLLLLCNWAAYYVFKVLYDIRDILGQKNKRKRAIYDAKARQTYEVIDAEAQKMQDQERLTLKITPPEDLETGAPLVSDANGLDIKPPKPPPTRTPTAPISVAATDIEQKPMRQRDPWQAWVKPVDPTKSKSSVVRVPTKKVDPSSMIVPEQVIANPIPKSGATLQVPSVASVPIVPYEETVPVDRPNSLAPFIAEARKAAAEATSIPPIVVLESIADAQEDVSVGLPLLVPPIELIGSPELTPPVPDVLQAFPEFHPAPDLPPPVPDLLPPVPDLPVPLPSSESIPSESVETLKTVPIERTKSMPLRVEIPKPPSPVQASPPPMRLETPKEPSVAPSKPEKLLSDGIAVTDEPVRGELKRSDSVGSVVPGGFGEDHVLSFSVDKEKEYQPMRTLTLPRRKEMPPDGMVPEPGVTSRLRNWANSWWSKS